MNKCDIVVPLLAFLDILLLFVSLCLIAFGAPMIKLSKGSTYIKPSCQQYVRKKRDTQAFFVGLTTRELETMWYF